MCVETTDVCWEEEMSKRIKKNTQPAGVWNQHLVLDKGPIRMRDLQQLLVPTNRLIGYRTENLRLDNCKALVIKIMFASPHVVES